MMRWWRRPRPLPQPEAEDPRVSSALRSLDPGTRDPAYWMRFQSAVLAAAGPQLARRRLMAELTVGDVLAGWARAVVPTAVLAAAVAALILFRTMPARDALAAASTVEELLTADIGTATIPEALEQGEASAAVSFAGERF